MLLLEEQVNIIRDIVFPRDTAEKGMGNKE